MIALVLVTLSLVSGSVLAQVPGVGKCPDVQVKKNFQPERYLGEWYEITRFDSSFESGLKCSRAFYYKGDDDHITVFNLALDQEYHEKNITGDAYSPDKNEKAKLKVVFEKVSSIFDFWVLETDYDNYTLAYSCVDLHNLRHLEFAWILSRTQTLEPEVRHKLYHKLDSYGISSKNFIEDDQTNCYYDDY